MGQLPHAPTSLTFKVPVSSSTSTSSTSPPSFWRAGRMRSSAFSTSSFTLDSLLSDLDDGGDALAAAYTHGRQTVRAAFLLERMDEGGEDAGARGTNGVAEGDGATVGVDFLHIQAEFLGDGPGLGGEGFVRLD